MDLQPALHSTWVEGGPYGVNVTVDQLCGADSACSSSLQGALQPSAKRLCSWRLKAWILHCLPGPDVSLDAAQQEGFGQVTSLPCVSVFLSFKQDNSNSSTPGREGEVVSRQNDASLKKMAMP